MAVDRGQVLGHLREMNEYDFERFIADLWERQGWDTTLTQGSNDGGIDVVAEKMSPFDQKHLIQAKKYGPNTTVRVREVREYSSLRGREGADAVIVVTTGSFSRQALDEAERLNVKLIDSTGLLDIIHDEDATDLLERYIQFEDKHAHFSGARTVGESTDSRRRRTRQDHPFGDIPSTKQKVIRLDGEGCPNCGHVGTLWETVSVNTGRMRKCESCSNVWYNLDKGTSGESAKEANETPEPLKTYSIPEEVYKSTAWRRTNISVALPIVYFTVWFLGFMAASLTGLATLAQNILTSAQISSVQSATAWGFLVSGLVGYLGFVIYASRDKRALEAETGGAYPRYPIQLAVLLVFTFGLYALFYLYWRRRKYNIGDAVETEELGVGESTIDKDEFLEELENNLQQVSDQSENLQAPQKLIDEFRRQIDEYDDEELAEILEDVRGDNWQEIANALHAEVSEEDTKWNVVSSTRQEQSEWLKSVTPAYDESAIRNEIYRSLDEAYTEGTTSVICWDADDEEYVMVVEFDERVDSIDHDTDVVETTVEIGKKESFGEGLNLSAEQFQNLEEDFEFELTVESAEEDNHGSIVATREVAGSDFNLSSDFDAVLTVIQKSTGRDLRDTTSISVIDAGKIT